MKITGSPTLCVAALALLFSACGTGGNTTANNSTVTNTANKANTSVVTNSSPATATNTAPASNTSPTPSTSTQSEDFEFQGELRVGKTESLLFYFGEESGDYAAYCFSNDSEAGRAIMAACKDKEQCAVKGSADDGACKVPGLEADLSASGRITKVTSAKSLGRKK